MAKSVKFTSLATEHRHMFQSNSTCCYCHKWSKLFASKARYLVLKRLIFDYSEDFSKMFKDLETRFWGTCSSPPRSSNQSFAYFSPFFHFSFSYLACDSVSFLDKMPSCKSHKQVLMKLLVETSFDLTLQCYCNPLAYVFPCFLYLDNVYGKINTYRI